MFQAKYILITGEVKPVRKGGIGPSITLVAYYDYQFRVCPK